MITFLEYVTLKSNDFVADKNYCNEEKQYLFSSYYVIHLHYWN